MCNQICKCVKESLNAYLAIWLCTDTLRYSYTLNCKYYCYSNSPTQRNSAVTIYMASWTRGSKDWNSISIKFSYIYIVPVNNSSPLKVLWDKDLIVLERELPQSNDLLWAALSNSGGDELAGIRDLQQNEARTSAFEKTRRKTRNIETKKIKRMRCRLWEKVDRRYWHAAAA